MMAGSLPLEERKVNIPLGIAGALTMLKSLIKGF